MTTRIHPPSPLSFEPPPRPGSAPAVLDALACGVLVVEHDTTVRYRNRWAASKLGSGEKLDAVLGGACFARPFDGWARVIDQVLTTGSPLSLTCALPAAGSGAHHLLSIQCLPLPADGTVPPGAVLQVEEDQRPEHDEETQEVAQRLVALGRLASRVAHELNNPLDGILRYINLALRLSDREAEPKLRTYLTESRTGLIRMVQIIADLLEYSRTTAGAFDEIGVNEVVEQAVRNAESAVEAHQVIIAVDYQRRDMPAVHGTRLYQVCVNLIKNAIDAMPDGGRLSITTGIQGTDVVIRVADTGQGLPAEVDKVFEPFFTTKPAGQGTGLGLAICKDFVEAMEGEISAAPGEDGGAVFTVRIPVSSCRSGTRLAGGRSSGIVSDGAVR